MLEYELTKADDPTQHCLSPDGKEIVLLVEGKNLRLLFIPIKEGMTEKDVRVVELRETK
jgi:hypothetical protein